MTSKGEELSRRLQEFCDDLSALAHKLTEKDWNTVLEYEQWPVGVTMRHLAAGHLDIGGLARMIINGDPLPEITFDILIDMANRHAQEHAGCKKEEVLSILEKNSKDIVSFTADLTDEQLDRTGYLEATGDVSAQQVIEFVVFQSAAEHVANIKKAVGM